MGDAIRELREWQRAQAGRQDKALRSASRSWECLAKLEADRVAAVEALSEAVGALVELGLDRDRVAGFLDLPLDELTRVLTGARRGTRGRADDAGAS